MEDRTVPTGLVTEFSAGISANSFPYDITTGADGNLWFTEANGNRIGRITPAGTVTEFGAGITANSSLEYIAAGNDGNLWFTEDVPSSPRIGRITPSGIVTEFGAGITFGADPVGITAGPDGNLWFAEYGLSRIGRITPAGTVTEFNSGISANSFPTSITTGPDGNMWFIESGGDRIGRITPNGSVIEFSNGISASSGLGNIAAGPDGNVWFTEQNGNRIGRITPSGTVTEFGTGISADSLPEGIAAGPDGNMWFTERFGKRIGRITPTGTVTEFSTGISVNSGFENIKTGVDGNLWSAEADGSRIARLGYTLPTATTLTTSASPATYGQPVVLTATLNWSNPFDRLAPAGTVSFYDGTTRLGSTAVSGGQAVLNIDDLSAGSPHTLTAQYAGDIDYDGSPSPVLPEQVNAAATAVSLSAPSSSTAGDLVTLTATVTNTDSPATPAGYVTFLDGNTPVGVATLSGGLAAVGISPTLAATHHLTAAFTPAGGFQPSQTPTTTDLTVDPAAASQLAFVGQPGFALSGKYIQNPVGVAVEDKYGNVETGSSAAVTVSLAGPGKSALAGTRTQTAAGGVATFPDLKVTGHGAGFTLSASSVGLASGTSLPFAVSDAVKFKIKLVAPAVAGQPFTVIVSAVDSHGRVDPYYLGGVNFAGVGLTGQTSGTFAPGDLGKKAFTLTLPTAGKVALTVADTLSAGVVGKLTVTLKA